MATPRSGQSDRRFVQTYFEFASILMRNTHTHTHTHTHTQTPAFPFLAWRGGVKWAGRVGVVGIDSAIQNSGDAFCAPPSLLHELFICPRPFPERSAGPARFKRGHQNGPPKRIGSRPSGLTCLNIARLKHSLYGRSSESGHNSRELSLIESRKYAFSRHKRISSDGNAILLW